jgi:chromosome segregation protein
LIEIQSALTETEEQLAQAQAESERLRFAVAELENVLQGQTQATQAALEQLNESDAAHAALVDQASQLGQDARAAQELITRYTQALADAESSKQGSEEALAALEERLRRAGAEPESEQSDPGLKDRLAEVAEIARAEELQAQLALRTAEERARALGDRAESLARSVAAERVRIEQAAVRRAELQRDSVRATAVRQAIDYLAAEVERALADADADKQAALARRTRSEQGLQQTRARSRELAREFEDLVDVSHRDQLAKAERKLRLDALSAKALDELGFEPEALVAEYGPDKPVSVRDDETGETAEAPYVRAEQEKRLRAAKRDLAVLGKVNPLALEEFEALQERHTYLAEQLEDVRKTRTDLIGIIDEVDSKWRDVFEQAFADVATEFQRAFDRLFPGGEGKLILTEPDSWLTSGVDVEARPAGKKVKRLSLLSGGERSLVAIAFLVALFKARPSPFYILDEVEAALDDTNLGRLLQIYEELRADSQLLVITHQKRTMEVADALYGVTMGSDGVSQVISQRIRER